MENTNKETPDSEKEAIRLRQTPDKPAFENKEQVEQEFEQTMTGGKGKESLENLNSKK